jgi:hypothetical protein
MSAMSENLSPLKVVFSFGNSQKSRAPHEQGHCYDARSKHWAKVQVFSDEQPHVTLSVFPNNNAGSLFDLVQEIQSEQRPNDIKNEHCLHLGS